MLQNRNFRHEGELWDQTVNMPLAPTDALKEIARIKQNQ